jgi:uncharacterized protein (TIGR00725 family)
MIGLMMISVVGGDRASEAAIALAEDVGRELADRGCTVVCGGRSGVMEAVCRGARSHGGHTIGILPTMDRSGMNPYVEFPVVTGIGYARNAVVVLSGEAIIAVEGSYGTLSEIALALAYRKPVIALGSWQFDRQGHDTPPVIRAIDARDAVEKALAAAQTATGPKAEEVPSHGD